VTRERVVVSRALGLGDLCTAVPALRGLRRAFPHHELVLAAPGWQDPIARQAGVDRVVDTSGLVPHDRGLAGADVAVNLHGKGPESTRHLLDLDPAHLIAVRHECIEATWDGPSWGWLAGRHEVERWCALLAHHGIDADPTDLHVDRPVDARFAGAVVVHPGAASPGRRWPAERFGAIVRHLAGRGERVVLTGSTDEVALCRSVLRHAARPGHQVNATSLAGTTDLNELWALVAGARMVVANDTGVAHLATACRTPSVVLFGPTSPHQWGPPRAGPHRALWKGHTGDPHATELDAGLAAITVDDVLDAIDR
jgi:ADP-heptose:LPS heptosyltransferase